MEAVLEFGRVLWGVTVLKALVSWGRTLLRALAEDWRGGGLLLSRELERDGLGSLVLVPAGVLAVAGLSRLSSLL